MNLLPSKFGPLIAINRASLLIDRVSVEIFEKLIFLQQAKSKYSLKSFVDETKCIKTSPEAVGVARTFGTNFDLRIFIATPFFTF